MSDPSLRVLSTMALDLALRTAAPLFERETGMRLDAEFMPTVRLMERIRGGERGDVAILTIEATDVLVAEGVLVARTDLARSFVGVAVREGAQLPDISTPEAFVATLLGAKSIALSQAGASGIFMTGLLERLGIADAIRPKATVLSSGYTAALAASGAVEIAIQQVSELMAVPGVAIVGRLPAALGGAAMFSAGVFRGAGGQALIDFLAAPERGALYRECGLEPASEGDCAP